MLGLLRVDLGDSLVCCRTTRGHQYKLLKHRNTLSSLQFFTERVVNVDFKSLAVFKRTIKCVNYFSHCSVVTNMSEQFVGRCKCIFVPFCPVRLLFDFTCYVLMLLERIKYLNELI